MPYISIVTCLNDPAMYESCVAASLDRDGRNPAIELIPVDNTSGSYTAASALNFGITKAQAEIIVCCHQDIFFPQDWTEKLRAQIVQIEQNDKKWGVLGVMGVQKNGLLAGHIVDPHTQDRRGNLPCEVETLDEVCLILQKSSMLRFDESLGGFHFYGADLCLQARRSGLKCYAIDAPIKHISGGKVDDSFRQAAVTLRKKWSTVKDAPFVIQTTCGIFLLKEDVRSIFCYHCKKQLRKLFYHKKQLCKLLKYYKAVIEDKL